MREYSVLQELFKIPHDHILLHLAAWSQGDVFYMIFPQARCNLRTFMEEVESPGLKAHNVIWFFKQLRGLADAVRHIHALKTFPALSQYHEDRPIAESDEAVFHNDIKPENILVFDSEDSFPGVFKISDFGCGKVVNKDRSCADGTTEGFYGTPEYESPDVVRHKEASKPNDLWALGCIYLELLDWFTIPRTQKQMSFQSQRYTGPGPANPAFWYRNPENQFQLTPQVGQKLMELEKGYCNYKRGLQYLLHIIWSLLHVDMECRWTAERVYNDMNYVTRQAMVDLRTDPDFYLRPGIFRGTDHLLIAAFPEPTSSGEQGRKLWPKDIKEEWTRVTREILKRPGRNKQPILADKHPKHNSENLGDSPGPEGRRTMSPFARKLQRLRELDQMNP
jgi:serine/threonine protein kinase